VKVVSKKKNPTPRKGKKLKSNMQSNKSLLKQKYIEEQSRRTDMTSNRVSQLKQTPYDNTNTNTVFRSITTNLLES